MLLLALFGAAGPARAHESDYSYLRLEIAGERVDGEWEIHLRDARIALGLAPDLAGEPAWAELRARAPQLAALFAAGFSLSIPAGACPVEMAEGFDERPGGREYALLRFAARCPGEIRQLDVGYALIFDLDAAHRGFFAARDAHETHLGVFTKEQDRVALRVEQLDAWRQLREYLSEGVRHIFLGLDHVLFLVALLLPAPLVLEGGVRVPRERLSAVLREVVAIVTAFTLAHSLTLGLAALGALRLPARAVETAIAASVLAVAWNNLRPFLPGRAAWLACGLGLVHGLGFAGALAQLGLPRQAKGLALFAFNAGVELGQLAIVAVLLPALFATRRTRFYREGVLRFGSLAIAWLAAVWLIERAFGVSLVPWP